MIPLPESVLAMVTLAVLAAVFIGFALELYPPQTTAIGGVAVLLISGALSSEDMLSVLSNPAPATIAALFVISGALTRTGTLDLFSRILRRRAAEHPQLTVLSLILGAMALSAFVNNTPVVMVLIPVAVSLAAALGTAPSRLLIPLSYATILGGVCTLLGTSTNLLVDGVAREHGLEPFGMFEMTPVGLAAALGGGLFLALTARRLLPERTSMAAASRRGGPRFAIEALIGHGSPLAGRRLAESPLFADNSVRVIDVLRGDESLRRGLKEVELQAGDRLVMRSDVADLAQLRDDGLFDLPGGALEKVQARQSHLFEALVGPGSPAIGKRLLRMRLRRRYGVYPLAVHRRGANLAARFETAPLEIGDTILLEGAPEDFRRVADDLRLVALSDPPERNFRPEKAPIVLGALAGVVVLSTLGVAGIAALSVIAVALLLFTRCVDADEAVSSIDGGLLLLIYSMLAMGKAMQTTGAVDLIVGGIEPVLMSASPWIILACVYLTTSLLTELVTNNAVAVVMAPVAIELAAQLGVDPRPLVLLVMIAASASFATPIGYQTNTLVYSAGGYRFTDFLRIGAPLNLLVGAIATTVIWALYYG